MATYKMKSTRKGVLKGEVHPVTFEQGNTYEIDDDLAGQWKPLDILEDSKDEPVAPTPDPDRDDLHENWLDTDRSVLRHGELTAEQVLAKDESPYSDDAVPAEQEEGKAEGDLDDSDEGKPSKSKKAK